MSGRAKRLTLDELDRLCRRRQAAGEAMPAYAGPLGRHVRDGDRRLLTLEYDDSPAALRLWNFLLTEEDRLHEARAAGKKIVGTMKDLGTVPVMAYALPNVVAFYPDGAWWTPCLMELSEGLFGIAQSLGLGDAFCPVRAMAGAFVNRAHFPIPDLATCSVGATCDDFSAIAQRLESLGYPITWWEMPSRRRPDPGEPGVTLPGGFTAPASQVALVRSELERLRAALARLAGSPLGDAELAAGIREANRVRALLPSCGSWPTRPTRALCRPSRCSSPRCWPFTSARTARSRPRCWRNSLMRSTRAYPPGAASWPRGPRACSGSTLWQT